MVDFNSLLNTKYAIMQQNADTNRIQANAQAGLQNAQAAEVNPNALAQRGLVNQQSRVAEQTANFFPDEAKAKIAGLNAGAGLDRARTTSLLDLLPGQIAGQSATNRLTSAQAGSTEATTDYLGKGINDLLLQLYGTRGGLLGLGSTSSGTPGFKKGIARVPGKGDGTKDTVSAKLAPGEAVLNKGAADTMGRGLVAALNAHGMQKMGMA